MYPQVAGQYKLVLVGDSAVGKSSLLSQFVQGKYDEHLLSTIGVDFKFRRVKLGKEEIKLQIWDTAGQQTFRSIVSAYYNSADAILLCYDISNYESFESLKDYWLVEANQNNKNSAKIFVVGNKSDSKKEVESYSLQTIKTANITAFYEVSAKNNTNVEETFTNIAKILHSSKPALSSEQNKLKGGSKIKPISNRKPEQEVVGSQSVNKKCNC